MNQTRLQTCHISKQSPSTIQNLQVNPNHATYKFVKKHILPDEAKLSSSSSTVGLDAQPSARPTALQSSRLMGLDLVPSSSIATHSTISTRYAVSFAIPTLRMRNTAHQRLAHFHFRFQFPFPFPAFPYARVGSQQLSLSLRSRCGCLSCFGGNE